MKKIFIITLLLIGLAILVNKINSGLNETDEAFAFHHEHNLNNSTLVVLEEKISPNANYKFYEYQFDNGGFGYSKVFWSVVNNDAKGLDLQNGILPYGYRVIDWSNHDELIIQKWEPYYYKSKGRLLIDGAEFNGVSIKLRK